MEDSLPKYVCVDCGYEGDELQCPHCGMPADPTDYTETDENAGKYPEELLEDESLDEKSELEEEELKNDEDL